MRHLLTDKDIKDLKYQCRMGIILPFLLLTISSTIIASIVFVNKIDFLNIIAIFSFAAALTTSLLLNIFMNRKYISDIKNGEKTYEVKIIQLKEKTKDFEAGSATIYIGQEMNEFYRYDLIIENTRYRVDKELFENCENGEEIVFFTAPKSKYLLQMELKKYTRL
jgi:hypothetical protein